MADIPGTPDFYVSTRYVLDDQASKGTQQLQSATASLDRSIGSTQSGFKNLKNALMSGLGLAGIYGAARGFGKLKELLVDHGELLEQTKIGIGALITESMDLGNLKGPEAFMHSMGIAKEQVDAIREAAAGGLGEFNDYLTAYQQLMIPISRAGGSIGDVLDMSRLLVPVAMALGQEVPVAANQLSMMFMGNARNVMQFLKLMGIDPKETNKLAKTSAGQMQLLDMMKGKFAGWAPAAEEFGKTLSAQTDTLNDNLKHIATTMGVPLRDAMTKGLIEANEWLEKNQDRLDKIINQAGPQLAHAFTAGFEGAMRGTEFLLKNGETLIKLAKDYVKYMLAARTASIATAFTGFGGQLGATGAISAASMGAAASMGTFMGTPNAPGKFFLPLKTAASKGALVLGNALGAVSKGIMALSIGQMIIDIVEGAVTNSMNDNFNEGMANLAQEGKNAFASNFLDKMGFAPATIDEVGRQNPKDLKDFEAKWGFKSKQTQYTEYLKNFNANEEQRRKDELGNMNALTLADVASLPTFGDYLGKLSKKDQSALRRQMKFWASTGELAGSGMDAKTVDRYFDEALGKNAKAELRGKVQQNNDFRGSKFEVVIDSGEYEPDTIAFELEDRFITQAAARVSSRFAPGLAGGRA